MAERSGGSSSPGTSLAVAVGGPARVRPWWRTPTARRYVFGYTLLAPAILYVGLLVGIPFLFSLYLSMSDASVRDPVASFVGLQNFEAALENQAFYGALRNTLVFTIGAGILKGLLGTTLAFLLVQSFRGRRLVRALVVIPFTLPIAVSVLGWKWMFDSQFSVVNWALSRLAPILFIGSAFAPVFPLSDLTIVSLLSFCSPAAATEILPTLAYNTGIRAGALGRGAAISLFLFPLLPPAMIILLRTLRRRQY